MIVFKVIRYKNFLSTGNNWTEIALDNHKHTLIVGQNGAGKSTMLDAISYALFGKSHRSINKAQLINSVNQKKMLVEVEFTIGKKEYKVVRGLKPSKFEIYADGVLLNQNSHNKEYQKILETNILGLTHKSFHQVVVLGSSSFIPFMQLTAYNRREVIEDLLDIGVFSKMNALLKERNATLKEQINQVYHAIEINDTKTEAQKKYIRDISKLNNDNRRSREQSIKEAQGEIERLVKENVSLQDVANNVGSEVAPKIAEGNERLASLRGRESEINTLMKTLMKETKFYEKNDECPSCEQEISADLKQSKIAQASEKAGKLQSSSTKVSTEIDGLIAELETLFEKQREVAEMQQSVNVNLNTIQTLNDTIEKAKADIESMTDDNSDLAQANDDYDVLVKEHHDLLESRNTLNDQAAYNAVIAEMLKDSGIKTKIIKQYLPVINKLVNQYLSVLDFYVHFNLDESFNETIKSRHRDAFSYDSFSEGEKQRIDLALLFTWRQIAKMKNSISTNLLVLDETFDSSLDEAGIDNLMKIIHTLGDDTNVFIISHKGEILDGKFEHKIEFVKSKNFSKVA